MRLCIIGGVGSPNRNELIGTGMLMQMRVWVLVRVW